MSSTDSTPPSRAVLYLRVSDTHGRDDGISFEVQERLGRELCQERGWTVVDVIRDPDRKGSTMDRPGLKRARAAIPSDADAIVVWRLDRFARTMFKALAVLQETIEAGGAVVSTHPQEQLIDTSTAIGRGIAALLFSIGEEELDKIRANWHHAIDKAVVNGWAMGTVPFGYVKPGWRQTFEPHPTNAEIVRELFKRAATGASYDRLRRWLAAEHDVHVGMSTVQRMLRNRVYLGEMNWGERKNARAHEPLMDELTWRRAQRHGQAFGAGREKHDPRLLSGIVRCAGCRSAMRLIRPANRPPYYGCHNMSTNKHRCAAPASIGAAPLEAHVERLLTTGLAEQGLHAVDDTGLHELQAVEAQLAVIDGDLAEYNRLEVQRALGDRWLPGLMERERELGRLRRERGRVLDALNMPEVLAGLSQPDDYLRLPVEGRREILAAAFPVVFVRTDPARGDIASSPEVIARRTRAVPRSVCGEVELPRAGQPFDWRPLLFGDEPEVTAGEALG